MVHRLGFRGIDLLIGAAVAFLVVMTMAATSNRVEFWDGVVLVSAGAVLPVAATMVAIGGRLRFLGVALLVYSSLALLLAGRIARSPESILLVWARVISGPTVLTALGNGAPIIGLAWFGMPLILYHPICPNRVTKWCSIIGLSLWFFVGALVALGLEHA